MPSTLPPPTLSILAPDALDLNFQDIAVGREVTFSWRAKARDIDNFADLSGDKNPLHMDGTYAQGNGFDGRVVHGFLLGAQVSGLIGMALPGRRCLLMEENLAFPRPIYVGDEVIFHGTVVETHDELSLIMLKVSANISDKTVMRGHVTCKLLS